MEKAFSQKVEKLKKALEPHGIQVLVDEALNPKQMRCEFYKNSPDQGHVAFIKGNMALTFRESGQLSCYLDRKRGGYAEEYDSDHTDATFEATLGIHTDRSLDALERNFSLCFENNNWFEVEVSLDRSDVGMPDVIYTADDVVYSLKDVLNAKYVLGVFETAEEQFKELTE